MRLDRPTAARATVYPALSLTATGVAGLAAVSYLGLATVAGQRLDERARSAVTMPRAGLGAVLDVLAVVSIGTMGVTLALFVVTAAVRRRWLVGAAAVLLVAGANITTQALKFGLLDRPDFGIGTENSLPSGHTTAVTSLGLAAILVFPWRWRPALVAAAAALATFVGAGTLVNGWHRPSDVVAAYAVCAVWAGIALTTVAGLADRPRWTDTAQAQDGGPGPGGIRRYVAWAFAGSAAIGVVFVLLGLGFGGIATNVVLGAVFLSVIGLVSALLAAVVAGAADRVAQAGQTRAAASR